MIVVQEAARTQEAFVAEQFSHNFCVSRLIPVVDVVHCAHVIHSYRLFVLNAFLNRQTSSLSPPQATKFPDAAYATLITQELRSGITWTLFPVQVSQMINFPSSEPETQYLSTHKNRDFNFSNQQFKAQPGVRCVVNRVDFVDVTFEGLFGSELALGRIAHVSALLSQLAVDLLLLLRFNLRD